MEHLILNDGSDGASLAKVALKALREARRSKTSRSGSVFVSDGQTDADGIDLGTGTIINGVDGGIQPWVGDTTPPGKPNGITAESHNGAVWVSWDGTLDGGIPADFDHVQFTAVDGSKTVDMGQLRSAGKVTAAELTAGDTVTITAVAYDDAHDAQGNSTPNASTPSDPVAVVVQSAVDASEVKKAQDDAQNALNQAGKAAQNITTEYAVSNSDATSPNNGWSTDEPKPLANQYVWMRTTSKYGDGRVVVSSPTRTTGNSAIMVNIHSTRGNAFHNSEIGTTMNITILYGSTQITDSGGLHSILGPSAYVQWTALTGADKTPVIISNADPMVSNDGFTLTLSPNNVDNTVTFTANVIVDKE